MYYHICTYQTRNSTWKPYCDVSFNMGWQDISKFVVSFNMGWQDISKFVVSFNMGWQDISKFGLSLPLRIKY
jgi:hypothetical protein